MKRQHFLAVVGYTSKRFWMLLIPLLRGLLSIRMQDGIDTIRFDVVRWAKGTKWDIAVVLLMIFAAVWRWLFTKYDIRDDRIILMQGFIFRRKKEIRFSNICAAAVEEDPLYLALGISRVMMDTDAPCSTKKASDVNLVLNKGDRQHLLSKLTVLFADRSSIKSSYTVPLYIMMLFSFFFSSAFSGVVLIMTALSVSTSIIGETLERDFVNLVSGLSDAFIELIWKLISGIDPAGVAVSVVIGTGFLMSFMFNTVRHLNFRIIRRGNCILISSGLLVRRIYCINTKKISMTDMRQNLMMKLFGLASVHISCTGYGKRKREIPVFIPICATRRKRPTGRKGLFDIDTVMEDILPEFVADTDYIRPDMLYAWRFLWPPALLVISIPLIVMILIVLIPYWYELLRFLAIISAIPAVWLVFAKAIAFYTTGLDIDKNKLSARYCKWFSFHSICVPLERLSKIRITQNLPQRINRSCDITVYTAREYTDGHLIRSMNVSQVQKLIRRSM